MARIGLDSIAFDVLTEVDRMSMATPLEVRVPILGHRFMGWIASLPVSLKFHNLGGKYILRQLAEQVGVPPQVLYPLKPSTGVSALRASR